MQYYSVGEAYFKGPGKERNRRHTVLFPRSAYKCVHFIYASGSGVESKQEGKQLLVAFQGLNSLLRSPLIFMR